MGTQTIVIPQMEPAGGFPNPYRTWNGIINAGPVTYDTNYGEGIYAKYLYVGTTGNVTITKIDGTNYTLPNMAAGIWHPVWSIGIASSGTTVAAAQLFWGN